MAAGLVGALTDSLRRNPDLLERAPLFVLDGHWAPQEGFHVHGPSRLPIRLT